MFEIVIVPVPKAELIVKVQLLEAEMQVSNLPNLSTEISAWCCDEVSAHAMPDVTDVTDVNDICDT